MSEQKTTEDILASMGVTPTAPTPTTFAGFVEVFDTFRKLVLAHERECATPVAYYRGRNQFGSPVFQTGVLPIPEGPLFTFPPASPDPRDEALRLAREALGEVQDLIGESHGVYGLHLNGDESPWGELEQGGRFERLTLLNEALAAIDEVLEGRE